MTPSHAVKKGTRYHYYVSRPLITEGRAEAAAGLRIPAAEIEQIVTERFCKLLGEPAELFDALSPYLPTPSDQQHLLRWAGDAAATWGDRPAPQWRMILVLLIRRIEVQIDRVDIQLRPRRLVAFLRGVQIDRDRGDTSRRRPSHTTGHTGPYHGGSIGLSLSSNKESGKTEAVEIRVAQSLLDRRMS
jgi:hypothetical protein